MNRTLAQLIGQADGIIDAMDNYPTRYLLNDIALEKRIPLFHGAIRGFYGQATTILPGKTACLRCIFPCAPPQEVFPVVGATPGDYRYNPGHRGAQVSPWHRRSPCQPPADLGRDGDARGRNFRRKKPGLPVMRGGHAVQRMNRHQGQREHNRGRKNDGKGTVFARFRELLGTDIVVDVPEGKGLVRSGKG